MSDQDPKDNYRRAHNYMLELLTLMVMYAGIQGAPATNGQSLLALPLGTLFLIVRLHDVLENKSGRPDTSQKGGPKNNKNN